MIINNPLVMTITTLMKLWKFLFIRHQNGSPHEKRSGSKSLKF